MASTSKALRSKNPSTKTSLLKTARKKGLVAANADNASQQRTLRSKIGRAKADRLQLKTVLRAKWIEYVDEHEDRPGQSLATRNHPVILRWAQERNAKPSIVPGSRQGDKRGTLRFDFPGYGGGKRLEHISWEEWFRSFDERELVFIYQEHLKKGNQSNFFRLDSPEREAA